MEYAYRPKYQDQALEVISALGEIEFLIEVGQENQAKNQVILGTNLYVLQEDEESEDEDSTETEDEDEEERARREIEGEASPPTEREGEAAREGEAEREGIEEAGIVGGMTDGAPPTREEDSSQKTRAASRNTPTGIIYNSTYVVHLKPIEIQSTI